MFLTNPGSQMFVDPDLQAFPKILWFSPFPLIFQERERGGFFTTANEETNSFVNQYTSEELVTQIYTDGAIDDTLNGNFRKAQHLCGDFVVGIEVHDLTTICQVDHK